MAKNPRGYFQSRGRGEGASSDCYWVNNQTYYSVEPEQVFLEVEEPSTVTVFVVYRIRSKDTGEYYNSDSYDRYMSIHLTERDAHAAAERLMHEHIARLARRRACAAPKERTQ